jgi:hypothetical protein
LVKVRPVPVTRAVLPVVPLGIQTNTTNRLFGATVIEAVTLGELVIVGSLPDVRRVTPIAISV